MYKDMYTINTMLNNTYNTHVKEIHLTRKMYVYALWTSKSYLHLIHISHNSDPSLISYLTASSTSFNIESRLCLKHPGIDEISSTRGDSWINKG